jgi:hypothetical protein
MTTGHTLKVVDANRCNYELVDRPGHVPSGRAQIEQAISMQLNQTHLRSCTGLTLSHALLHAVYLYCKSTRSSLSRLHAGRTLTAGPVSHSNNLDMILLGSTERMPPLWMYTCPCFTAQAKCATQLPKDANYSSATTSGRQQAGKHGPPWTMCPQVLPRWHR